MGVSELTVPTSMALISRDLDKAKKYRCGSLPPPTPRGDASFHHQKGRRGAVNGADFKGSSRLAEKLRRVIARRVPASSWFEPGIAGGCSTMSQISIDAMTSGDSPLWFFGSWGPVGRQKLKSPTDR